jgi:nitroreductase
MKGRDRMLKDLVLKNRTYRRFYGEEEISRETLVDLIELARLSSTGANLQQLKYIISNTPEKNKMIFQELMWAAYLKDWDGPVEEERPTAYLVIVADKEIGSNIYWNHGIACQSILLGATEKGLGGCMFGGFNKENLKKKLQVPDRYEILLVIALGKPKEEVVLEDLGPEGDIKYWRDEKGVHHVPKRRLEDLILDL